MLPRLIMNQLIDLRPINLDALANYNNQILATFADIPQQKIQ